MNNKKEGTLSPSIDYKELRKFTWGIYKEKWEQKNAWYSFEKEKKKIIENKFLTFLALTALIFRGGRMSQSVYMLPESLSLLSTKTL